jgi:4,5-DOPA dioxygenase extradiol
MATDPSIRTLAAAPDTGTTMPVLFIGHGSPMNAIENNEFSRAWAEAARSLPKPKAVLCVSAHWETEGTRVTAIEHPKTIHDFYGFPEELYHVKYPAPGAPQYAQEVRALIPGVMEDAGWGLDHGAWSILKHLFPMADIPVFQLSIDYYKPMQYHFDLGLKLDPLRKKGVLIIGSGNIVHNLQLVFSRKDGTPYEWAIEFDSWVKEKIMARDFESLVHYEQYGKPALLSIPTVDHYVPLLYSLALAEPGEVMVFTYEEVFTSLSMRCLKIG